MFTGSDHASNQSIDSHEKVHIDDVTSEFLHTEELKRVINAKEAGQEEANRIDSDQEEGAWRLSVYFCSFFGFLLALLVEEFEDLSGHLVVELQV